MPSRRQFSLSGNNFYPLVHICTKYMTYEEKMMYRRKLGIPSTIDEWVANEKLCTKAPTANPFERGSSLKYLLWQDDVECILNVVLEKVGI